LSENKDLILIDTALQDFDKISAGFTLLEKNFKGIVFEVDTQIGMEHAKAARAKIREPRYTVERLRKGAKAPLIAIGKRLDAEAARLTNALLELENPIQEQIKYEEDRQERERLERAQKELEQKQRIESRIQAIRESVVASGFAPDVIETRMNDIRSIDIDASFQEFQQQASDAKTAALARLAELHAAAIERVAEIERIAAERAELARLRAAQEERDREARADQARRDAEAQKERDRLAAIAQAERDAENARIAEANRIERERIAAEEAEAKRIRDIEHNRQVEAARVHAEEIRRQREAIEAEAAENRRIEAERAAEAERVAEATRQALAAEASALAVQRAEIERQQVALAEANKPVSKSQQKRLKAMTPPSRAALVQCVAEKFGVPEDIAQGWLKAIDWNNS
jgi:hypothetical protein